MQLRFTDHDDFITINKPYNTRTHQVSDGQYGFVDYLTEKLEKSLFVAHRLDKGTSGIMLFAKSKAAAASLAELFEKQQVRKTYYFLTDKACTETSFKVDSHIDKQHNIFLNIANKAPNSETEMTFISPLGKYFLWAAFPKTSQPHQIRLHAQKARIPILGDNEHGGSKFFRLALHAQKIEFTFKTIDHSFEAELPPLFTEVADSDMQILFAENYYKRHQLYSFLAGESYRLLHHESTEIRADVFADRLWVYDYTRNGVSEDDKAAIKKFTESKNLIPIYRHMLNRGQGVSGLENETLTEETPETEWIAQEEMIRYKLKTNAGFSPGLFLDQRENRHWVLRHSNELEVLNLFCYTSGFSVNSAVGNAKKVTSVDVSPRFLDWSQENFSLNLIELAQHEFVEQDAILFLRGSIKVERKWDLITCDPPSFARSNDSIWKLEEDLPLLAKLMVDCLKPDGKILFTCNLENITRSEIIDLFFKNIKKHKMQDSRLPMLSLDYELTDDLTNSMKGFLVSRPPKTK
jgi:23S rRNA (cytosine1962-C5)-methyltransferase